MRKAEIIKLLKVLADTSEGGQPRQAWLKETREILFTQIQAQTLPPPAVKPRIWDFSVLGNRLVWRPALVGVLIVAVTLTFSVAVEASISSLPGDLLYPVKITSEKTQLILTVSPEKKATLQIFFAKNRANELNQILQNDEPPEIKQVRVQVAVKQLKQEVTSVSQNLARVQNNNNSQTTGQLAKVVKAATSEIKKTVQQVSIAATSALQEEVNDALNSVEQTSSDALSAIIQAYESGTTDISASEVSSRLNEEITRVEERVKVVEIEINSLATTTVATSTSFILNTATVTENLGQAKEAVKNQKFSEALNKLQETTELLQGIENELKQAKSPQVLGEGGQLISTPTSSAESLGGEGVSNSPEPFFQAAGTTTEGNIENQ